VKLDKILVPLDGSMLAESIIPFLLEIAGPRDVQVALLRVLVPVPPTAGEEIRAEGSLLRGLVGGGRGREDFVKSEEYLASIAAELRARRVRVTATVRRGNPVAEILAGAREADADLIAMTTHGRSGLSRLLFGSVAAAVLSEAAVPVFLIRQTEAQVSERAACQSGKSTTCLNTP
jgi:nucleotide-binding universal stress UspA family protein